MEKRPLFIFAAAMFAGAFSAGLRPWYLTYAVLVLAPALCAFYCIFHLVKYRGGSGGRRYAAEIILLAAVAASLPAAAYRDCVAVWKGRMARFAEYDGAIVESDVVIKSSGTLSSGGRLRYLAAPLSIGRGPALGGGASAEDAGAEVADAGAGAGAAEGDGPRLAGDAAALSQPGLLLPRGMRAQDKLYVYFTPAVEDELQPGLTSGLVYGTVLSIRGRLSKPAPQQNEYLFDYQRHMYSSGVAASIYVDDEYEIIKSPTTVLGLPAHPIGAGIAARGLVDVVFARALPPDEAALMSAMLLGINERLDERTRDDFITAGLLHLTAVSGLHIMILARIINAAAKRAGLGVRAAGAISMACIVVFAFVAGFSASVVRAALSYALSYASVLAGRPFDRPSALGLAAIALMLYNPMQVFGAGFLLSFSSALSIFAFSKYFQLAPVYKKIPRAIAESISISLAVCVGCYPVQAALFHRFSTVTVISNLLCAPLVAGALATGIVTGCAGLIYMPLSTFPAYINANFLWSIGRVAQAAARVPNAGARAGALGPVAFAFYYAILALLAIMLKRCWLNGAGDMGGHAPEAAGRRSGKRHMAAAAAADTAAACAVCAALALALALLFAKSAGAAADTMEVVFLDVGNSNAAYVNIGGRYHILIDAGGIAGRMGREAGDETRMYEYLTGRGVGAVDLAIATHGDFDHIQGFWSVLEHMPVHRLLISKHGDAYIEELAALASSKGAQIIDCAAGDQIALGDHAVVEILSPVSGKGDTVNRMASSNDTSLVARIVFGDMKALFCADIGSVVEAGIVYKAPPGGLAAQLMSVPHHGSKYSSSEMFLAEVMPIAAVAGVGRNNYGHPAPETVRRYLDAGALFMRTDRDGMVTVTCDADGGMEIKSFNDEENKYAWERGK